METLRIKNFGGINKKADPTDIENHECQTLDGFDTYKVPGALVKRKGYTDQADVNLPATYPTSWTIKNFFRFNVTKPSTQTITVVHAQVGGEDRIYVDYTYDGSSWTQAWVELTENEEELTSEAGSNTTSLICSSLSSSTNDYYNGWYVFNWVRGEGRLVTDYVGASNDLTVSPAITGQDTSQLFSLYRFPLMTQFEGSYTADTDTSTTQIIDVEDFSSEHYELKIDFDDGYNDWVVSSADISDAAVSDFEASFAGNKKKLTHATQTGQVKGTSYFVYKPTRTFSVDDKVQFHQRPNTCVMKCGDTGRYPKQFPLWYGYIRGTYYFGQSGKSISAGYYLEPATLDAPSDSCINSFAEDTGTSDPVDAATYHVALAYVYDGYQVGPLTTGGRAEATKTVADGTKDLKLIVQIGYSSANNMRHSQMLNKRITGVAVFMANDFEMEEGAGTFYHMGTIPIREDFDWGYGGTKPVIKSGINEKARGGIWATLTGFADAAGRVVSAKIRQKMKFDWTGTDPYNYTFYIYDSTWDNKGFPYSAYAGGMGGDRIGYEVGDSTLNHSVVGRVYTDAQEPSFIAFSPLKHNGTPSPDYYPTLNIYDMAFQGLYEITDIKIVRNRVYVIGSNKIIRMLMTSGIVPNFEPDGDIDFYGTDAVNGTVKYRDGIFTVSKYGCFYIDNIPHLMSAQIEDVDSFPMGATTMSEAYVGFNGETSELTIAFKTDSKLYTYNIKNRQWGIHSVADTLECLVTGKDGELYASESTADGGKIHRLNNGTTDDGTSIAPKWKSKIYNMGKPDEEKIIDNVYLTYKSNTVVDFDVYVDRSGTAYTWNASGDNQFASSTSLVTTKLSTPVIRGKEFELEITIPSGSQATNTYVEIHEIDIDFHVEQRT